MQAGLGIVTYVPNAIPSVYAIYCTLIFGENDPVAATGAALETMYLNCPSCIDEFKKFNVVSLGGWTSSAYVLACREPIKTLAELKGKRVRATGGNAEMLKQAGMVPVGATLVEAVGLLQRGGLDCQHGINDWMRTFGYADVAKYVIDYPLGMSGPAIGFFMNRDTWNKLHARAEEGPPQARGLAERQDGDRQLHHRERGSAEHGRQGQGRADRQGRQRFRANPAELSTRPSARRNIATAKSFGVQGSRADHRPLREGGRAMAGASKEIGRDIDKFADVLMQRDLLQDRSRQAVDLAARRACRAASRTAAA